MIKKRFLNFLTPYLLLPSLFISASAYTDEVQTTPNSDTKIPKEISSLYQQAKKNVYQIRVLNKISGEKHTLGSGFVVVKNNLLATNYHVVSAYVNAPDDYILSYESTDNQRGSLNLIAVDVVNDLALLSSDNKLGSPFELTDVPKQGTEIFSMGNPLNLGFVIVTGINNGFVNKQHKNLLFSGSLNSGMSGGPVIDIMGRVIGVNVATSGNQLSYIIPTKPLQNLIDQYAKVEFTPEPDINGLINKQLVDNSITTLNTLINNQWTTGTIGPFKLPFEIAPSFECWDSSRKQTEKELFISKLVTCQNTDRIYVNKEMERINSIKYSYSFLKAASDDLWSIHFYHTYEKKFEYEGLSFDNDDKESLINKFKCQTSFVNIANNEFKTRLCIRNYIKYKRLSDIKLLAAQINQPRSGLLLKITMTGIDQHKALELIHKLLTNISVDAQ